MLPANADWRWMEHRADSPWYPTMRLFRQQQAGRWEDVIETVTNELRLFVAARARRSMAAAARDQAGKQQPA